MTPYEQNMYNYLKRKGFADKYEHAGIYSISIDGKIVYIGKSTNMLHRVAQHYVGIQSQKDRKYRVLSEARRKGHDIGFDVLYYAKESSYSAIKEEIGEIEGVYIRKHNPALNTQIPKETDWRKFDIKREDTKTILDNLI